MNAKKKNKKANKPPNPNPPQKLEKVSKSEENVKNIQPKCEVKKEEVLTPKICSEVIAAPLCDAKEIESETPSKPKRNKGKKTKQDKNEEFSDNVQETSHKTQTELNIKCQEQVQEIKDEKKGHEEKNNLLDEISVVPSARKKKNKKNLQEKEPEESKIPSEVFVPASKEHMKEEVEKVDPEIKELFSSKPDTPKQDPRKKKNKKKNRTDSERSDKSDTAVSCTAFQNLKVEDEMPKQKMTGVIADGPVTKIPLELQSDETEKSLKNIVEIQLMNEIKETAKYKPKEVKELLIEESKGNNKNKVDNTLHQIQNIEDPKPEVSQELPIIVDDILLQIVSSDEIKKVVKESIEIPLDSKKEREPSPPKSKAKIAKPVEKKRKDIHNAQLSENLSNTESQEITKEDTKSVEWSNEPEIKLKEEPTVNVNESLISDKTTQGLTIIPKLVESINVPWESTMGKKRKKSKSPKPPKNKETDNVKIDTVEMSENIPPPEVHEEIKDDTKMDVSDIIQDEAPIASPELLSVEMLKPQDNQKIDITESILLERVLTPELIKDDEGFEIKTSKKKKKTPKPQPVEFTSELEEPPIQKTEDDQKKPEKFIEQKIDDPFDPFFVPNLDVHSTKAHEIDALTCDAIPDILFVRSSSQYFLDDNNNTVIQELINADDIKLNDPLLIPLIEGSGETPSRTPELIISGIRMTDIEAKTSTEEKLDIKSKMMEVNQDMEELKLSIERSLSEFTALEKCEHESEKIYGAQIELKKESSPFKECKTKDTKNISVKKEKSPLIDSENKDAKLKDNKMTEENEIISAAKEIKESEKPSLILEKVEVPPETPPVCPARKDNKGKSKSKKKGKQEIAPSTTSMSSDSTTTGSKDNTKEEKKEKTEHESVQKSESTQEKGKQQSDCVNINDNTDTSKEIDNEKQPPNLDLIPETTERNEFEPIENFEDALTSSIDDVNKTFEMIVKEVDDDNDEFQKKLAANKPKINVMQPTEDTTEDTDTSINQKVNPVSQPKNLLGQTDIPVQSNKTDYKKEKNKTPNARQARVKIKDSVEVEAMKKSKESQTDTKKAQKNSVKFVKETFSRVKNEEYVYKYSFRKVFLQSACHVCNKDLKQVRVPCGFCNLLFYCSAKHKDEDWPQHQALCFAVCTLAHMKDQKHIYADAQLVTGQDYRLLRMQMIVSCEKVLKRRLVPWEQEAMLYPRICADVACREWRQGKLNDCDGCSQLSYCTEHPDHLPKSHTRWCQSYCLYRKLVGYQQTKGRLEPRLPTKLMARGDTPEKMNEALAAMYEEKIEMNDTQYAALTQLATAPLTAAYCLQLYRKGTCIANDVPKKQPFTIHVVGAELQFEADALNKWETFFLHVRPEVEELRVVLVSSMLNPGNLPMDLLGRIKLCDNCLQNKRRVVFKFEDNKHYFEYRSSEDFINPDIICAFNPSIQRSSIYDGKDPWPATINSILKLKQPFMVTSYTLNELRKDVARIKQVAEMDFKLVLEPGFNSFASVRPDRNFISDDEMPLLFKNYCVAVVLGC